MRKSSPNLEKTVVASVNPLTGRKQDLCEAQTLILDKDATIACRPCEDDKPAKTTEEFMPVRNSKPTGEMTTVWQDNEESLAMWFRTRFSLRRALVVSTVFGGIVAAFAAFGSETAPPEEKVEQAQDEKVDAFKTEATEPEPAPEQDGSVKTDGTDVTAAMASDALLEGKLEVALLRYRRLVQKYPENRTYPLAVSILKRQKRQKR